MDMGPRSPARMVTIVALLGALACLASPLEGAPAKPVVLAVIGHAGDAGRLAGAQLGASLAAAAASKTGPLEGGVLVEVFDDEGTKAGFKKALKKLRARKPVGVLGLPTGDLAPLYWKAAGSVRVPWLTLAGLAPDRLRSPDHLLHVGPTTVGQGMAAADAMVAPLAARRVAVVHGATPYGRTLAAAFSRNLSARVKLAGLQDWELSDGAAALRTLKAYEAEWLYVALNGAPLHAFTKALAAFDWRPKLLFADGARDASLLEANPKLLEGAVFLGAPDPERFGRLGEAVIDGAERAGKPLEAVTPRAYEAARRLLAAVVAAGSTKLKAVWTTFNATEAAPGVMGKLAFEPFGGVRLFQHGIWRVTKGTYEEWPDGLLPTPGCGPPIGFGLPPTATLGAKGKYGVMTWGGPDKRTIEQDLFEVGLCTQGKHADLDEMIRQEILGRAIRIANRLFRREADGTAIPGWSFGLALSTKPLPEDVKKSRQWLAVCAGDHPGAGGQAFGTWVAVYTTFLKRTMYAARKLDPPISNEDRKILDGTYRWGTDRALNFRADKIRCLMDGFASAMGLTLSHEFGHLCGCGHDTEHPTSIMNVVAGAGATWESAVWISRHERHVIQSLGIAPVPKER